MGTPVAAERTTLFAETGSGGAENCEAISSTVACCSSRESFRKLSSTVTLRPSMLRVAIGSPPRVGLVHDLPICIRKAIAPIEELVMPILCWAVIRDEMLCSIVEGLHGHHELIHLLVGRHRCENSG